MDYRKSDLTHREKQGWGWAGGILTAILLYFFAVDSSTFVRVSESRSFIDSDGVVTFYRNPMFDGMRVEFVEELVDTTSLTCENPGNPQTLPVESNTTNTISFPTDDWAMQCLGPGSVYRLVYQYKFFRPNVVTLVVPTK